MNDRERFYLKVIDVVVGLAIIIIVIGIILQKQLSILRF